VALSIDSLPEKHGAPASCPLKGCGVEAVSRFPRLHRCWGRQAVVPTAQKFWFRRYARFLKYTHPTVFEARAIEWRFFSYWLDHFDGLDDDASRRQ